MGVIYKTCILKVNLLMKHKVTTLQEMIPFLGLPLLVFPGRTSAGNWEDYLDGYTVSSENNNEEDLSLSEPLLLVPAPPPGDTSSNVGQQSGADSPGIAEVTV